MPHGLTHFTADAMIDKAKGALDMLERALDGDGDANQDAMHEAVRVTLENQMAIAETLALIKAEFDKFEEGISKIL